MKRTALPALLLLMLLSCRPDVEVLDTPDPAQQWNRTELDAFIWKTVRETGAFDWNAAPLDAAWGALQESDGVLSVGYKPAGYTSNLDREIHRIDLNASDWQTARRQVLQLILEEEKTGNADLKPEQIELFGEGLLPVVNVRVTRRATLEKLRAAPQVRYAEPMGYEPSGATAASRVASSSGCGEYGANPDLVPGVDFTTIAPDAKVSWNHPYHRIGQAWTRAAGSGIKVMIIDTGVDPHQANLGGNFNQGEFSQGRTLEKRVTLPRSTFFGIPTGPVETPDDPCGHGTAMAGVLAAPRAANGNAVGVAYDCDLVTVRAAADVLLDESREVRGVSDAFVLAGNRSDIRVVSMSLGRITLSSQIADAVRFAFNRGKLIFCAAGTSFGWSAGWFGVIFPATMTEVSAVTGVKEDFRRCNNCHDGSQTDFVVVMEKVSNGLHPITTATSGDQPGTVGGSSVATAQTAGMAALVWSRFPDLSRDEVLQRLVRSGSFFPNRNGSFGWGAVNADAATGEAQ